MEYLRKHNKITQDEYCKIKEFIISQLKMEDDKGHTVELAIKNVENLLYDRFIQNNIVEKHIIYFGISYNALIHHHYNYDPKKVDPILKTLENAVFKNFNSTIETFKIHNIDQENFENMTFEKFYPEILKLVVYQRCYSRLDNSIPILTQAIKLFYETGNYDSLDDSLLQDERDKITTERIQKIFKKQGRILQIETTKKSNESDNKDINRFLIKYKEQISKLNDNEKALLLSLCVRNEYGLPATEKIKLILISGSIYNDFTIFEEKPGNNTLYNKINKGIKNNMSKDTKINLIESTLEKIKIFNLEYASEILESIKPTTSNH